MSQSCQCWSIFALSPTMKLTATVLGILATVAWFARRRNRRPLPPGPKGLPILGVATIHPKTEFWKTYALWGKQYGGLAGIISFHVLGRRMIILNTLDAARDLLDKRSANYSERPFPVFSGKLMKREKSIFYSPYNDRLKAYRRLMAQQFNPVASRNYWGVQEHEARILVNDILRDSSSLVGSIRKNAAAVTMKITYGINVTSNDDHFVNIAEESMRVASLAARPGRWLVDSLPFLQYLPSWFPGAGFKKQAKAWGDHLYLQSLEPHNYVKREMAAGMAFPSFTSRLLQPEDDSVVDEEMDDIILWTAGGLYAAGADTTVAAMETFFFNMMTYPEVQKRAQDEVDTFIAKEQRLPLCRDRAEFPYAEALLKEVMRWASPSPMGLFHATRDGDIYKGYHIPGKTIVIANIWGILHNETVYPDPMSFKPERFLSDEPQPNPLEVVFGFGRRICPGQHLAESTVLLQMIYSLAILQISLPVDAQGREYAPEPEFTTGIVSHVKLGDHAPRISIRSEHAHKLLNLDLGQSGTL